MPPVPFVATTAAKEQKRFTGIKIVTQPMCKRHSSHEADLATPRIWPYMTLNFKRHLFMWHLQSFTAHARERVLSACGAHLAQAGGRHRLGSDVGQDGAGRLPKLLLDQLQRNVRRERLQPILQLCQCLQADTNNLTNTANFTILS